MFLFNPSSHAGRALIGAVGILFVISVAGLARTAQQDFQEILYWYAAAFCLYLISVSLKSSWRWWIVVGIAARCVLVLTFPSLSDDVYRFFWDGNLVAHLGISPYHMLPSELTDTHADIPGHLFATYPLLNSPEYYSVYPPVLQLVFALAAWCAGGDIATFAIVMKLMYVGAECLSLHWMYLLLREYKRIPDTTYYVMNPLVIIEGVGNLHAEILVISCVLGMLFFLRRSRVLTSGMLMSLAIGLKLLPALFLPFVATHMHKKVRWVFAGIVATLTFLLLVPAISYRCGAGILSSTGLYFRNFEFNAGIYSVVRWIGFKLYGYNIIAVAGPALAVATVIVLLLYWWKTKHESANALPRLMLVALTIYLFGATTVHPWYLCPLVALSVLTGYRYPVVWSAMIILSYAAYRSDPPGESAWMIASEYLLVYGWCIWEMSRKKNTHVIL